MPLNYRPYEQQQLEALLSSGMTRQNPEQAYQIFQGLQGGAIDRRTQMQAQNASMMDQAMQAMQGYATSEGADQQGLDALMNSYQAANPQLEKPKFASGLEALVQSLAPMTGGGGGGNGALTTEDASQIAAEARAAATGENPSGKPIPLHDARMAYMSMLRAAGVPEETLTAAYDLYGQQYDLAVPGAYGGSTPLTMADRTPQSWTAAALPQAGGGGGGMPAGGGGGGIGGPFEAGMSAGSAARPFSPLIPGSTGGGVLEQLLASMRS